MIKVENGEAGIKLNTTKLYVRDTVAILTSVSTAWLNMKPDIIVRGI